MYQNKMIFFIFVRYKPYRIMNIYKPEIAELLLVVEKKYGKALRTSTDFEEFSFYLKRGQMGFISPSTLKRLWGYVNDFHKPRMQTLDLLSRYIGFRYFSVFCDYLKTSTAYNSSFFSANQIVSKELSVGEEVEIGWSPNRYLRLVYRGDGVFEVEEVRQSKLRKGDRFETSAFLMGQPLYLSYILREGLRTSPFIAGRNGGLTLLNRI